MEEQILVINYRENKESFYLSIMDNDKVDVYHEKTEEAKAIIEKIKNDIK